MKRLGEKVKFSFWEKYDENHTVIRFATSWATKMEDIDALIDILYHMKKNEFNGTVSIQMEPVSIRKSVYYETSK